MADGLRIAAPGVATTLQDAGRRGYLRFGISGSGAMDPDLLALANALVGNPADAAAIEMAMLGPTLVCEAEICRVALAGAPFAMALNGRVLDPYTAYDLRRATGSPSEPLARGCAGGSPWPEASPWPRCSAASRPHPHPPRRPRRQSPRGGRSAAAAGTGPRGKIPDPA